MQHYPTNINSELFRAIAAIDGACDPAFDNALEELERQFAELRISQARDLN
jgi:hypothetical protein